MAHIESILVTSMIDAHEWREVVTKYIPVTYLSTYVYEEVIMVLEGGL